MRFLSNPHWQLVLLLLVGLLCVTHCKRGGGSRGGGSRSRGSTSSRTTGTRYGSDRYREQRQRQSAPAPAPRPPPAPAPAPPPAPAPKPSAPREPTVVRQPAQNPNYREPSSNQGINQPASNPNYPGQNAPNNRQPPPYSPAGPPPPYAPGGPPPAYSPGGQPHPYAPPAGAPPAYSPPGPGFKPGVNPAPYPQQPGVHSAPYPQQPGVHSAPYPQQPGMRPAPYPQQPGMRPAPYPQQPGMGSAPYPQQPGMHYPRPGMNSPYQPGMHYPQQPGMNRPFYQQPMGSNLWAPQSGRPSPAYMNYGGIPTGANMYGKPQKQKGFLGSLMSLGGSKYKKNKYYGSSYGSYGMGKYGGRGGFLGKYGTSAALLTILPFMVARSSMGLFRPRLGFFPMLSPSPFYYHHHHYGYNSGHSHYYDVYNEDYVGKCRRPIKPNHSDSDCNSTHRGTKCQVNCTEGYTFPDNTTTKDNQCWHVTGVWRPTKNFPECQAVCNDSCLNGGSCIQPGVCGCAPEYRGSHCEFRKLNFLKCDIRKMAGKTKISWVCTHTKNETSCRIKCKPPATFVTEPVTEYKCTPDGTWTPDSVPECLVKDDLDIVLSTEETTTVI